MGLPARPGKRGGDVCRSESAGGPATGRSGELSGEFGEHAGLLPFRPCEILDD